MHILDTFASLAEARGEAEWCAALFTLSARFGFERTLFAVVPRAGLPLEQALLRSSYDARWRAAYVERGMVHVDPTVAHCLTRTTPLVWSPEIFSDAGQSEMYEEACAYGLRTGISLPMRGPQGETGMLCFVTERPPTRALKQELEQGLPQLALLRDVAFDTSLPHLATQIQATLPSLTPRERECLKWTAVGKSSWEISRILRCSEAAINFHMSNIRRKLNVSSRRAAAVRALLLGLISLG